jgi:hypothetical protein
MTTTRIDAFTTAYIEAALWSSTNDAGEPLDGLYSVDDLSPECLALMVEDCKDFQDSFGHAFQDDAKAGHMFWLTRNRHGAGFWDGDYSHPLEGDAFKSYKDAGAFLTAMSHPYGEFNLYVGDDGMIHGS